VIELCPRCAKEEVTDPKTGWGEACSNEVLVEDYLARESEAADERHRKWKERSDAPEALKWRQRKHRLYAAVQPKERPGPFQDPWELAREGLNHLAKIRTFALKAANGQQHLEAVQEIIRQLAVGTEDS
jgi:hypothetical protein